MGEWLEHWTEDLKNTKDGNFQRFGVQAAILGVQVKISQKNVEPLKIAIFFALLYRSILAILQGNTLK